MKAKLKKSDRKTNIEKDRVDSYEILRNIISVQKSHLLRRQQKAEKQNTMF